MSTYRPRATAGESVAFAQDVKVKYTANQECADECRTLILQLCESVLNVHDLMTAWKKRLCEDLQYLHQNIAAEIVKDNGPAEFDFQYGTEPIYSFYAAPAPPNTPPRAMNTFYGSDEASPAPRSTPYLDITSPTWILPKGSPLASPTTFDMLFRVSERDHRHIEASTPTPGSRSNVYRPSRKRRAGSPTEKDIQGGDLDSLWNREVASAENAAGETGKRRRVATVEERT